MMKMIIAILHNTDGESTLEALTQADFRVTRAWPPPVAFSAAATSHC